MRFLSMIRINESKGQVPSERLKREMGQLMEEMTRTGELVSTAGLMPTSQGKRVRLRHGAISVTDGPFTETKEVIGGFALLEAASMDEAVALTKRFLEVHGDEWDLECEVRAIGCAEPARVDQARQKSTATAEN
ncbi:MAG TPA: YciI family protein [Usitatibacter sp.]|nr:YciI family protein [Usitatibacter sp.]